MRRIMDLNDPKELEMYATARAVLEDQTRGKTHDLLLLGNDDGKGKADSKLMFVIVVTESGRRKVLDATGAPDPFKTVPKAGAA